MIDITLIYGRHYERNFLNLNTSKDAEMIGKVINIDAEILGGTPVFYGTRVPIKNLFDYLETGETIETFLQDFEGVQRDQVLKILEMSQKFIETSTGILHENFA
jgi:uncharacterized protein (DUF433 family)